MTSTIQKLKINNPIFPGLERLNRTSTFFNIFPINGGEFANVPQVDQDIQFGHFTGPKSTETFG